MQVMKKCCGQCLFTKNKIVSDNRKKQILIDCKANDTHFTCHKATMANKDVVCRGFYESETSNMIRISQRLGMINFVSESDIAQPKESE